MGYATEAVEAALRICFEDLGLRRVTASCFTANTASYRLMERVGMRREGRTVKDALHPSGKWMDVSKVLAPNSDTGARAKSARWHLRSFT